MKSHLTALGRIALMVGVGVMSLAFLTAGLETPQRTELNSGAVSGDSDQLTPASLVSPATPDLSQGSGLEELNRQLAESWQAHVDAQGLEAASPADWLTVCRRLSLALVGTGVSLEEIRQLQAIPEHQRVQRHRERLLRSGRFHDYWAERYTRFLVGADEGPFLVYRRRRFRTWLSDQFARNRPYDDLVQKLVTAQGLWTDRPEVNFYTVTYDSGDGEPDPIRMAARTTRAFLGIRIDCLQCHDDFLGNVSLGDPVWMGGDGTLRDGTQQDFHGLAAFFTAARASGLRGIDDKGTNYRYQYLHADQEVDVRPRVPFLQHLFPGDSGDAKAREGATDDSGATHLISNQVDAPETEDSDSDSESDADDASMWNARRRLAVWLTHPENKQFSRAAVVRVWTLLFGRPPASLDHLSAVDDLPLDATDHPMIAVLTDAFIRSGYDLRFLIRTMTDSPAFRVDSRAEFEITQRHEDAMASFPIVQLRGDQVAGAAVQAGRLKTIDRDSSLLVQFQRFGDRNDFLRRYGDLGEDEFSNQAITLTQRLTMLNGKLIDEYSDWNPVLNASAHVGMFADDDAAAVESLYLSVLNRQPSAAELVHFEERLSQARNRKQAIEDMVWVLFNSSEFAWNH